MPLEKINSVKIFYQVYGDGVPILFIMGLGSTHEGWKKQIEFFRDKNKVIVFDNRGCGKSDKPIFPYPIKTMADDSIGLLDFLKIDKAHIVGVSLGGMIAQEIAINYPERVLKVVIVNTYAKKEGELAEFIDSNMPEDFSVYLSKEKAIDFMVRLSLNEDFINKNPEVIKAIKASNLESFSTIGFANQYFATKKHDTMDRLHLIKAPTLIMSGENDRLVPSKYTEFLHEKIPGSKFEMIKGGSHAMNWENPKEFNEVLAKFLEG